MRRKALLDAEHWFSLVGKKSDVAGSFGDEEIELISNVTINNDVQNEPSITQDDKTKSKTGEDSRLMLLPDESDDSLLMVIDPAKSLVKEEDHVILPVTFAGAQSPDALFFRTPELSGKFVQIQNALYNYFDCQHGESVMDGSISCAEVGFVCAVQFVGRWYRARVLDVENHPDVVLSLLDKGLSIMAHASQIRRLPEELADIPRTVLHCSLSGIYPSSASSGWSPEVTQQ